MSWEEVQRAGRGRELQVPTHTEGQACVAWSVRTDLGPLYSLLYAFAGDLAGYWHFQAHTDLRLHTPLLSGVSPGSCYRFQLEHRCWSLAPLPFLFDPVLRH